LANDTEAKQEVKYLSVCSGLEAATVAWHPLGWEPTAFSEVEPFPRAVLSHHYPDTPLHGDFTTITEKDYGKPDLIVGGTPCQAFSVAGLRRGLADDRGNLTLEFARLVDRLHPKWVVWENVPGVLSIDGGRAFGSFLGALAELGYGFAYRVLDAQYVRVDGLERAVPQRRRRVFVIGCLGDWRSAASALFESESLRGNTAPGRKTRKEIAGNSQDCVGDSCTFLDRAAFNQGINAQYEPKITEDAKTSETLVAKGPHAVQNLVYGIPGNCGAARLVAFGEYSDDGAASTLKQRDYKDATDLVYGIPGNWIGRKPENGSNQSRPNDNHAPCLTSTDVHAVCYRFHVRRLTPLECERLQGFPEGYTNIPFGKPKHADQICPDNHRYKALGNSMAVNVMRWIGQRIADTENRTPTRQHAKHEQH
jgi:DNA (cytosine-5)-methyltransferase 1